MKKLLFVTTTLLIFSCSDGDLEIETLDFDSVSIEQCGTASLETEIFFKRNSSEVLILNLQTGLLLNEVSAETIVSTIPGQSQLIYRIFDDNVSSNYFCDDFPPATPRVIEEIEAEDGQVLITTTTLDNTTFTHTIQLQGISLVNAQGERITDLSINEFGEVTTTVSN